MKKRVVFTACDSDYIELFYSMFYPTLRQFGRYRDDVRVILVGAVSDEHLRDLQRRDLAIETGAETADGSMMWKFEHARRLHEEYEEVWYFDSDFWFQSDIHPLFERVKPHRLTVTEEQFRYDFDRLRRGEGFNDECLSDLIRSYPSQDKDRIFAQINGRRLINGGFFGGRRLGDLHRAFILFCQGLPPKGFGFDQASLNLWACAFPDTINRISSRYALPLANAPKSLRIDSKGRIRIGAKQAIGIHANNARQVDLKLKEPRFRRFLQSHPEYKPGLDQKAVRRR